MLYVMVARFLSGAAAHQPLPRRSRRENLQVEHELEELGRRLGETACEISREPLWLNATHENPETR